MALKVGELFASLRLDDKDFNQGVDRSEGKFGGLAKGVAKGGLVIAGALGGIGVASGVMAAGFEKDMANVATLLGRDGSERVKELGEDVKRLSTDTGKPLDDLAGGLYQVVSAFGDTADSAAILEISAKASTAGLATTTDAVNLLSATTKGYGDTSAEAVQKASDLAFQTVKLGQTSFPELAANMGKVIPLASTLGVKQEELFGAMAALTGVTGNTAEVSTQLKAANQALIDTNPKMLEQLKGLGFETGAAAVESLGFKGTLDALSDSVGGDTKKLAEMFGSVEALGAVLALTGAQSDDFTAKTAAMEEATGATNEAFEIQQGTVSAMFERVKASAGVLLVNLGEKLLPMFSEILDAVLDNMPAIQEVIENVFTAIGDTVTWLIENVWPVLVAAFTFFAEEIVPIFVGEQSKLQASLGQEGTGGIISWLVDDIIPMLAAAFTLIAEEVIPRVVAAFEWISANVLPALVAVFQAVVGWISDNWPTISSIVGQVAGAVGTAFGVIAEVIKVAWPVIETVASVLFPILGRAAGILLGAIDLAFKGIGGAFEVAGTVATAVYRAITGVWRGLSGFFRRIWDGVSGAFRGALNALVSPINAFLGFLNRLQIRVPSIEIPFVGTVGGFGVDPFNFSLLPRFAAGVRNFRGGLAVVGEHGPELVNLPRGADVFSNRESRGMSGDQVVVHVNAPTRPMDQYDIGLEVRRAVRFGVRRRAPAGGSS